MYKVSKFVFIINENYHCIIYILSLILFFIFTRCIETKEDIVLLHDFQSGEPLMSPIKLLIAVRGKLYGEIIERRHNIITIHNL